MVLLRTRSRRTSALDVPFPRGLLDRLARTRPLLDDEALLLVEQGLRQWLAVCQRADGEPVAMPSTVVDELWHELVLHTRAYAQLCSDVFGRFLHHTPEEVMSAEDAAANSTWRLRQTYLHALQVEAAEPVGRHPLPLLFRVDGLLRVRGGRGYVADCGHSDGVASPCAPPPGATCLAHLPPPPARSRPSRSRSSGSTWTGWSGGSDSSSSWTGSDGGSGWGDGGGGGGDGGGGGCGGGCGGG